MDIERRNKAVAAAGEDGRFPQGTSRRPVFGESIRGIWASEDNPIRDGRYVETVVRTGRMNRGAFYRLTNGKGKFWEFPAEDTVFLTEPDQGKPLDTAVQTRAYCPPK